MKKNKIFLSTALLMAGTLSTPAAAVTNDSITASDVFTAMPAKTLDLLTTSMRRDMLDYYKADSICNVMNTMKGFSHLVPPVTPDYLQVMITPVSRFTVSMLPYKNGKIAMTIYTVGDSVQAEDSEIRFYDSELSELKRDKFIKTLSTDDFLDLKGADGKLKEELRETVPFPTVKYTVSEDGKTLKAELTVGEFLSKESLEKIAPYLRREREYSWNGKKWELNKLNN